MFVNRVVIRELRALHHRDDPGPSGFGNRAVCVRGLNGSGKTTWLEAVTELFQWFHRCANSNETVAPRKDSVLHRAGLAAIELHDFGPDGPLWLACGPKAKEFSETCKGTVVAQGVPNPDTLRWWRERASMAVLGMVPFQEAPPNILYLEAIGRHHRQVNRRDLEEPKPTAAWLSVNRYEGTGTSSLDRLMRELKLVRGDAWPQLQDYVHLLRPGLLLRDDFDEATLRPLFELPSKKKITTADLSAGEQALLIALVAPMRWCTSGSIVLVDEPELHQHVALTRGSLQVLDQVVTQGLRGQLLVASHAPEVWDHFESRGHAIVDLS